MAESTDQNSFPDLNAVIKDQQVTIDQLAEKIESEGQRSETIFNTTPTAPKQPTNYVVIFLIGAIIFLILRGKK